MILIIFWPWMSLHFPCFIVEYLNPQPQDGWILGKGHIYDRCGHFYFPRDSALTIFHYYLIIGAEYSRYRWACFSVPVPKMRSFSYLQAENPMIQFSMRHYDPSQQLNMKMAAYLSGCGHFLYFNIYKLKIWCYNIRWMITSQGLSLLEMTVLSGMSRSFFYLHRSTLMLLFKMRHYAPSQSFRRWLHSRTDVAIFFSLFT